MAKEGVVTLEIMIHVGTMAYFFEGCGHSISHPIQVPTFFSADSKLVQTP